MAGQTNAERMRRSRWRRCLPASPRSRKAGCRNCCPGDGNRRCAAIVSASGLHRTLTRSYLDRTCVVSLEERVRNSVEILDLRLTSATREECCGRGTAMAADGYCAAPGEGAGAGSAGAMRVAAHAQNLIGPQLKSAFLNRTCENGPAFWLEPFQLRLPDHGVERWRQESRAVHG